MTLRIPDGTRSRLGSRKKTTGQIATIERETGLIDLSLTLPQCRTVALNSESPVVNWTFLGGPTQYSFFQT